MSGKSEEKAKNVDNIDYSNNPPPEIAHQGREINLKIRGGEKKSVFPEEKIRQRAF